MSAESVKVCLRFRNNTRGGADAAQFADDCQVSIKSTVMKSKGQRKQTYRFDRCWQGDSTQDEVYEVMGQPLLVNIFEGYNSTLFVYGQTGSGKTYTMFGPDGGQMENAEEGIVPRLMRDLFHNIQQRQSQQPDLKYTAMVSIVDVYLEKVRDLQNKDVVRPNSNANNLKVRWDKKLGVYLTYPDDRQRHATEVEASTSAEVLALINGAIKMRSKTGAQAKTKMNAFSSRSHFVIQINLKEESSAGIKTSKLLLCDLAGSEKVRNTGSVGLQLDQAKNINYGLSVLGNVLNSLTDKKRLRRGWGAIPFRDSKLTSILQDSLGGNSKTALICTCRPDDDFYAETISTLRFGSNAKKIQNKIRKNETLTVAQYKSRMKLYERRLQTFEVSLMRTEKKYDASSKWAQALEADLGDRGIDIVEFAEKHNLLSSSQIEEEFKVENEDKQVGAAVVNGLLSASFSQPGSRRHTFAIGSSGLPMGLGMRRPSGSCPSCHNTPRASAQFHLKLQDAHEEIHSNRAEVRARDDRIAYLEGQLEDYHLLAEEWVEKDVELRNLKGDNYSNQKRLKELEEKVKFLERDNHNLEQAGGSDCIRLVQNIRASSLATAMKDSQRMLLRVQTAIRNGQSEEIVAMATDFAEQASEIKRLKAALASSQTQNKALHALQERERQTRGQHESQILDVWTKYKLERNEWDTKESGMEYRIAQFQAQIAKLRESRDDAQKKLRRAEGGTISDIKSALRRRSDLFHTVRAGRMQALLTGRKHPPKKHRRRRDGRPRSHSDAPPAIRHSAVKPAGLVPIQLTAQGPETQTGLTSPCA